MCFVVTVLIAAVDKFVVVVVVLGDSNHHLRLRLFLFFINKYLMSYLQFALFHPNVYTPSTSNVVSEGWPHPHSRAITCSIGKFS